MDDNESLYGGGSPVAPEEPTEPSEGGEAKTALLDSSICPGMKPGDEFTVRVEQVLDSGEYAVSYPEGSKKAEEPEPPSGDAEMASYMS